jgi:hypothetical protein
MLLAGVLLLARQRFPSIAILPTVGQVVEIKDGAYSVNQKLPMETEHHADAGAIWNHVTTTQRDTSGNVISSTGMDTYQNWRWEASPDDTIAMWKLIGPDGLPYGLVVNQGGILGDPAWVCTYFDHKADLTTAGFPPFKTMGEAMEACGKQLIGKIQFTPR